MPHLTHLPHLPVALAPIGAAVLALSLSALLAASPAFAAETVDAELAAFEQLLRARNPGSRITAVSRTPVAGLYEVQAGRTIVYLDATARYGLFGSLYDFQAGRDLTADRAAAVDRIDPALLDKRLAIRHVRGNGSRVLYVFADPQCGYCRQQEQALQSLEDVTVYTFVIALLGPESSRLAAAIACAERPPEAWSDWMLRGTRPASADCDAQATVAAATRLAQSLGVEGTPTLIAGDGRRAAGAKDAQSLAAFLAATPPTATGAAAAAATR